jgi:magnesium-transporting ATPase (P-type)
MEENISLFSLTIDPTTKTHLFETARWARFLAIVGFVFLVLVIFLGVYSSMMISRFEEGYRSTLGVTGVMNAAGAGVAVMYIVMAVVAFFPLLFTFRFSSLMRHALNSNDQALLNASFQNLKVCFRYLGIITIIFLVMTALTLVFGIAGLAAIS